MVEKKQEIQDEKKTADKCNIQLEQITIEKEESKTASKPYMFSRK